MGAATGPVLAAGLGLFAYVVGLTYAARQEAYDRIGAAWPLAVLAVPVLYGLWRAAGEPWALVPWALLVAVVGYALSLLRLRGAGDVLRAVVTLIAGIALYDAVMIAAAGALPLAVLAIALFGLTVALQRVVSGT